MVLSIDTFSDNFSFALISDGKVLASLNLLKPKPFSEILMVEIGQMFEKIGCDKHNISAVVVNKGPGSNTGLRVGVTTAKTISYVLNIPIYAYVSLDVMAYQYRFFCGKIIPAINIGKGNLIYKIFENNLEISGLKVETIQQFIEKFSDIKDILIVEKNLNLTLTNSVSLLNPLAVCGGIYAISNNLKENPFTLEPIYHS